LQWEKTGKIKESSGFFERVNKVPLPVAQANFPFLKQYFLKRDKIFIS